MNYWSLHEKVFIAIRVNSRAACVQSWFKGTSLGRCPTDTALLSLGAVVGAAPHSAPHWLHWGITKCAKREVLVPTILHIHYFIMSRTFWHRVNGRKQQGASAFARADSSVTPSLLSRKLGAVNFFNIGNCRIDVKSGYSSLAGCDTIN